jgi:hypothetical protein
VSDNQSKILEQSAKTLETVRKRFLACGEESARELEEKGMEIDREIDENENRNLYLIRSGGLNRGQLSFSAGKSHSYRFTAGSRVDSGNALLQPIVVVINIILKIMHFSLAVLPDL